MHAREPHHHNISKHMTPAHPTCGPKASCATPVALPCCHRRIMLLPYQCRSCLHGYNHAWVEWMLANCLVCWLLTALLVCQVAHGLLSGAFGAEAVAACPVLWPAALPAPWTAVPVLLLGFAGQALTQTCRQTRHHQEVSQRVQC